MKANVKVSAEYHIYSEVQEHKSQSAAQKEIAAKLGLGKPNQPPGSGSFLKGMANKVTSNSVKSSVSSKLQARGLSTQGSAKEQFERLMAHTADEKKEKKAPKGKGAASLLK